MVLRAQLHESPYRPGKEDFAPSDEAGGGTGNTLFFKPLQRALAAGLLGGGSGGVNQPSFL